MNDTWPRRGNLRPWVLGHRGARREAPENTLLAFERALAQGADGVEFDVQLAADGVPVVCHDPDLTRLTGGRDSRLIAEVAAKDLARVELEQGACIPTLSEVLRWAAGAGAVLDIELKGDGGHPLRLAHAVAATCRNEHPTDGPRLVLSSFHLEVLVTLRALGRPGELALLAGNKGPMWRLFPVTTLLGITGFLPEFSLLRRKCQLEHWHRTGCFVGTWTVNSESDITRATELGADVLIGDDPALLRRLVS